MKITNPKNGQVFESKYINHVKAHAALGAKLAAGEFAEPKFPESIHKATLLYQGKQLGSASQLYWLHKLATEGGRKAAAPMKRRDLSRLVELLTVATENNVKNPTLRLVTPRGVEIRVGLAGPKSRYPGAVMVSSRAFRGPYYGRIMDNGDFFPGRDYTEEVGELLNSFAKDPEETAASQGGITGSCCLCNKALVLPKATTLGYHPQCSRLFGLSHSEQVKVIKHAHTKLPKPVRRIVRREPEEEKPEPKPVAKVRRIIRRVIDQA